MTGKKRLTRCNPKLLLISEFEVPGSHPGHRVNSVHS